MAGQGHPYYSPDSLVPKESIPQYSPGFKQPGEQYAMSGGDTFSASGQRRYSQGEWTSVRGGQGRDRCPTWSGPPQEWGSDTERLSEPKTANSSSIPDDSSSEIGSSVSTHSKSQMSGLILIVPPKKEMMDDHRSYHQSITAKEAERRLKLFGKDCCYLTRYSKRQKCYVLSVFRKQWPDNAVEHLGILIDKGQYKIKGNDENIFPTIDDLLKYYERNRISPGFPRIGQSYSENEFNRQQHQLIDDERWREEAERRKKEEEQKYLTELQQERIKLLKELQEAKDAAKAAEQQKERDLRAAEERKRQELQAAEDRKQEELQAAEARKQEELRAKQEELEAAEARKQEELRAKQEELEAAEARKQEELRAKQEELEAAEARKQEELRAKQEELEAAEAQKQEELRAKQEALEAVEARKREELQAKRVELEAKQGELEAKQGELEAKREELVAAENRRQDDLRAADQQRLREVAAAKKICTIS